MINQTEKDELLYIGSFDQQKIIEALNIHDLKNLYIDFQKGIFNLSKYNKDFLDNAAEKNLAKLVDNYGKSFLHLETCYKDTSLDKIKKWIKAGADINLQDNHQYTPLHYICNPLKLEMMKYLVIEKNCNVNLKNYKGYTPLDLLFEEREYQSKLSNNSGLFGSNAAEMKKIEDAIAILIFNNANLAKFDINNLDKNQLLNKLGGYKKNLNWLPKKEQQAIQTTLKCFSVFFKKNQFPKPLPKPLQEIIINYSLYK